VKVGIIGSGLQCGRRIESIIATQDDAVSLVLGNNKQTLRAIADKYNVPISIDPEQLFADKEIESVVICTPPSSHYEYMRKGLLSNKKILVEKPLSKSSIEVTKLIHEFGNLVQNSIRCGFNHRFHPAIQMTRKYIAEGKIGDLLFGRAIYGIGARPNYTEEWRANPDLAAGGQFIEQGSHLIDLFQWIIGPVSSIYAKTSNNIFQNQSLDDGGMAILSFERGISVQLHTTLAQWHNKFEFEIYGTLGFVKVSGLGNTYGIETFEHGERDDYSPFNSHTHQFRGQDKSWLLEWQAFKNSFLGVETDIGTIEDGYQTMLVAEAGYRSNSTQREVSL
jgi:predicted dehydrogenase